MDRIIIGAFPEAAAAAPAIGKGTNQRAIFLQRQIDMVERSVRSGNGIGPSVIAVAERRQRRRPGEVEPLKVIAGGIRDSPATDASGICFRPYVVRAVHEPSGDLLALGGAHLIISPVINSNDVAV